MDMRSQGFPSIDQVRDNLTVKTTKQTARSNGVVSAGNQTFGEILEEANSNIKFSKHASERLELRNIAISDSQKARLIDATSQAKQKGMRESLVMVDDLAFIVNVKNNIVVTAVNDVKQGVFTNIDGAIIN